MSAHLLRRNFRPRKGLHRSTVTELWHVDSIDNWTPANTQTAVYAQIPYTLGIAHPDIGEAILTDYDLVEKVSNTDAIVVVYFNTNHGEVVRFRSSSTRGYTGSLAVPNWSLSGSGANQTWVLSQSIEPREYSRRVETRYVRNGSLSDPVREDILSRVGTIFNFPDTVNGIPHLLKAPSIVDYAPGQSRLIYTFETKVPVLAMPVGTLIGQNVALPALGYLQEYFAPEGQTAGVPHPIQARSLRYPRTFHFSLPFLL